MKKSKHQPTKTDSREKLAIWVDNADLARLRAYQADIGVPVSESIRRAINSFVGTLPKPKR